MDRSYINVYLFDGAKYTVTGLSCKEGDNCLVYYGYDAATDGNGTVNVKNGSTDVTSASKGYKTTTYTFTATPASGYKFKNWTKGAGGDVLGTDASINVTCGQNGQYQVYANFESDKTAQTITAADVTINYGDTDKKVSATTNGKGAISYAVKDGSAEYIDVNSSSGALTIKKVGTATVVVTAAETDTYAQTTKEVTVTINKANAVAATVTANSSTYDGMDKPLVTVTGEPTGGEMPQMA